MEQKQQPVKTGPQPEQHRATYSEAFGLYDVVRLRIFEDYLTVMDEFDKLGEIEAEGFRVQKNERCLTNLKFGVIRLYIHIRDKLTYPKYPKRFECLRCLDEYALGNRSLKEMELREAKFYFLRIRSFLEVDGITKFEKDKDDVPKEYVMARLAKGVLK
jgi:hypothetical protein